MMTATASRMTTVRVTRPGVKPSTFKFSESSLQGRAARWLQKNCAIGALVSETVANLLSGGRVEVLAGGRIADLYPLPTVVAEPAPEPVQANATEAVSPTPGADGKADVTVVTPKGKKRSKKSSAKKPRK